MFFPPSKQMSTRSMGMKKEEKNSKGDSPGGSEKACGGVCQVGTEHAIVKREAKSPDVSVCEIS